MKNAGVCKGCKYHKVKGDNIFSHNTCDYAEMTGHSRLAVEMNNGGYEKDSCPCYGEGKYNAKVAIPWGFRRGVNNES